MLKRRVVSLFAATALTIGGVVAGGTSIAAGKTIYLGDTGQDSNAGTEESAPVKTLLHAMTLLDDGDTLRIAGQYTERLGDGTQGTRQNVVINKAITIEGGVFTLTTSTESKLYITKDVTFKNLSFGTLTESSSPFRVFANGHRLTFDNVKTTKDGSTQAPTLYTGSVASGDGTGTNASVTFINSPASNTVKSIFAANEGADRNSQAASAIPATITLDENVVVDRSGAIKLGPNSAAVVLHLVTRNVREIDATGSPNNTVNITATGTELSPIMKEIHNLHVGPNVRLTPEVIEGVDDDFLAVSSIRDTITVAQDATLDLVNVIKGSNNRLTLSGEVTGPGTIKIAGGESTFQARDINGPTFEIVDDRREDTVITDHQYILPAADTYTLRAKNNDNNLVFVNGQAKAPAPQPTTVGIRLINRDPSQQDQTPEAPQPVPFESENAADYTDNLSEWLTAHPDYILLTDEAHAPRYMKLQGVPTVEMTVGRLGTLTVVDGTERRTTTFSVDPASKEVSYTLPAAPAGRLYTINDQVIAHPTQKVVLTDDARFTDVEITLIPRTSQLSVIDSDSTSPVVSISEATYTQPYTGESKKAVVLAELAKQSDSEKKRYVLVDQAPVVTDDASEKTASITWKAKKAGALDIQGTQARQVPFVVETNEAGQNVKYVVPAAPEGKQYLINGEVVAAGSEKVLTGEARFTSVTIVEQDVPTTVPDENTGSGSNAGGTGDAGSGDNTGNSAETGNSSGTTDGDASNAESTSNGSTPGNNADATAPDTNAGHASSGDSGSTGNSADSGNATQPHMNAGDSGAASNTGHAGSTKPDASSENNGKPNGNSSGPSSTPNNTGSNRPGQKPSAPQVTPADSPSTKAGGSATNSKQGTPAPAPHQGKAPRGGLAATGLHTGSLTLSAAFVGLAAIAGVVVRRRLR